jgi:hypothetical protein
LAKWGWGILLVISALLALDGAIWYFIGPNIIHARLVAVLLLALGMLALLVALEGYRNGSPWAWYSSWILVVALLAVGGIEVGEGEYLFGFLMLGLAVVAFAGQLLARKDLSSRASQTPASK